MKKTVLIFWVISSIQTAFAQEESAQPLEVQSFDCGTDCKATLYDNGLLKITPTAETGSMTSYEAPELGPDLGRLTTAPWADYKDDIFSIEVSDGITNVGYGCFTGLKNVTDVKIADSVITLGVLAFADETGLENVTLGNSVKTLGKYAFANTFLNNINLPDGLEKIDEYALWATRASSYTIPDSVTEIGRGAFYNTGGNKVYCKDIDERCEKLFFGDTNTYLSRNQLIKYTKEGDRYVSNSQRYKSLKDLINNNPVKHIYTINEANAVTGTTNTFSIRYR